MVDKNLPSNYFQTFYVSKDESHCPLIADAVGVDKRLKKLGLKEIIISQRYGKRILINSISKEIGKEDFLEIVDYDPVRRVLLVMGTKEPRIETPLHWFVHYAKNDINIAIQVNDETLLKKIKKIPMTNKKHPAGTFEESKEVLIALRDSKKVLIKDQGILFVGNTTKELEDIISKTFEELK